MHGASAAAGSAAGSCLCSVAPSTTAAGSGAACSRAHSLAFEPQTASFRRRHSALSLATVHDSKAAASAFSSSASLFPAPAPSRVDRHVGIEMATERSATTRLKGRTGRGRRVFLLDHDVENGMRAASIRVA